MKWFLVPLEKGVKGREGGGISRERVGRKGHDSRTNVTIYFHYDIIRNETRDSMPSPFALTRTQATPLVKFKVRSIGDCLSFGFFVRGIEFKACAFAVWYNLRRSLLGN